MLERQIRDEFDRRDANMRSGGGDLPSVIDRGRKLRRRRAAALVASGLTAMLVVLVGVSALIVPPLRPVAAGPEGESLYLIRPDIELPIAAEAIEIAGVTIYSGLPGPAPQFQPEGTEQALVQNSVSAPVGVPLAIDDAVHLGTVGATDVFVFGTNRVGLGGSLAEAAVRFGIVGREDSGGAWITATSRGLDAATMHLAPSDLPAGPFGMGLAAGGDQMAERYVFTWVGLPSEAAAVTFAAGGEILFWQRPVARVSAFVASPDAVQNAAIRMVAYDADGEVLAEADQTG